jgi:uncharacterized membrane protein
MAFCANCGSQVDGRFCPKCGAAVGVTGSGAGSAAAPAAAPASAGAAGLTDNAASALCYVFLLGVLFLLLAPYNQNRKIRFHAFQSIFLVAAAFVVWMGLSFVMIAAGGMGIFFVVLPVLWLIRLGFFVLWLFVIIKTYQDQKVVLPIIGPMAEKQAGS